MIGKFKNIKFLAAGDSCLTIEFGDTISFEINKQIRNFKDMLDQDPIDGIVEIVPAFCSVMICYNPCILSYENLVKTVKTVLKCQRSGQNVKQRIIEIPVCYSERFGEDLNDVAAYHKLSKEEVIDIHSRRDYLIYMLGFLPGFAYLGNLDQQLVTPRLSNPRTKVPAGAVGIGGVQTGIYPLASPGGWRLIGKTPVQPYDPERENPILYEAGDYIRFKPIEEEEYFDIEEQVANKTYHCRILEGGAVHGI